MKRVVITGIGLVTPLGNHTRTTWDNVLKQVSGVGPVTRCDTSGLPGRIAGELKGFDPQQYLSRKDILRLDPFVHYAAAAAEMACEDTGLLNSPLSLESAGVVIGSSRGGLSGIEKALQKHLTGGKPFSAYLMSSTTINMASSYISMKLGTKGPAVGISTACASGTNAIGEASRMIRCGGMDVVLAGGADAPICRLSLGGYGASGSLSARNDDPEKASRPFDRDRDGFVIAEGAGVLVLEESGHALKRGARIYAELAGYGTSSDAYHQTRPDSRGEAEAIRKALHEAGILPEEVDYVNAHAPSTLLGDREESRALHKVFGDRTRHVHVSACKSLLGHMLGAAGAVEAAITAMSIYKGVMPPTINLENPDPECDLNHVTSPLNRDVNIAVSNSFGFGGVNAVLVFKKFYE